MSLARCPVCEDVLTLGISVKLNQILICPTCLSSLQVVCLSPIELETPERRTAAQKRKNASTGHKSFSSKNSHDFFEADDLDEEETIDDYQLERKLRHKSDRPRRQKEKD